MNETESSDPMVRHTLGQELVQEGRHAEALREFLWCFDHGVEQSRAYRGVRRSFLLGELMSLASVYPPAREAVVERRNACAMRILTPEATAGPAQDLVALNEALGRVRETLQAYDRLLEMETASAEARQALFPHVFPALLRARRYVDIATALPDPVAWVQGEMARFVVLSEHLSLRNAEIPDLAEAHDHVLRIRRGDVRKKAAGLYEALLGAGEVETARLVAASLTDFDDSAETRRLLRTHARRAGRGRI